MVVFFDDIIAAVLTHSRHDAALMMGAAVYLALVGKGTAGSTITHHYAQQHNSLPGRTPQAVKQT